MTLRTVSSTRVINTGWKKKSDYLPNGANHVSGEILQLGGGQEEGMHGARVWMSVS